jgi:hypothetical protein
MCFRSAGAGVVLVSICLTGAGTVAQDPTVVFVATGDPEGRGGAGLLVSELGGDPGTFALVSQEFGGRSVAEIFGRTPESC